MENAARKRTASRPLRRRIARPGAAEAGASVWTAGAMSTGYARAAGRGRSEERGIERSAARRELLVGEIAAANSGRSSSSTLDSRRGFGILPDSPRFPTGPLRTRAGPSGLRRGRDVGTDPTSFSPERNRETTHDWRQDSHPDGGLRPPALDASAREIVDHAKRTGARVAGPIPLPTRARSTPSTAARSSTRRAVSSSRSVPTSASSTSPSPTRAPSRPSTASSSPPVCS